MSKWVKPEGYVEKKHNIVYKTTCRLLDKTYYYVGKHSTNVLEDGYLGSGRKFRKFLLEHPEADVSREVLSDWPTALDALVEEERVVTLGMLRDPLCLNSIKGGGTFDTTGRIPSQEERDRQSEKLKGHFVSEEQKQKVSAKLKGREGTVKGRVWVHKGDINLVIPKEEIGRYCSEGFVRGKSKSIRKSLDEFHKNSVWVHKGTESKLIGKDQLEEYRSKGFQAGRVIGKINKVWMTDGVESKMVNIEEIHVYLDLGWKEGRKIPSKVGKVWVTKDGQRRCVSKEESILLQQVGWRLGQK